MRGTQLGFLAGILSLAIMTAPACSSESKKRHRHKSGQLELSDQFAVELKSDLRSEGNLTEAQAEPIVQGALVLAESGTSLWGRWLGLADSAKDVNAIAPAIAEGAIGALDAKAAKLSSATAKIRIARVIAASVTRALKGRMATATTAERLLLPGKIARSAVGALPESGLTGSDMADAIGQVVGASVEVVDDAGFATADLDSILAEIARESVDASGDLGFSDAMFAYAMQDLMAWQLGALEEAGLELEEMYALVDDIMMASVGALDEAGLESGSQMQLALQEMLAGALAGFGENVDAAASMELAMQPLMDGVFEGMAGAGLDSVEEVLPLLDAVVAGGIEGLDDAGFTSGADIGQLAAWLSGAAVMGLDEVGAWDASQLEMAAEEIGSGALWGLGELNGDGVLSDADLQLCAGDVASEATEAFFTAADDFSLAGIDQALASSFAEGTAFGLFEAGWSETEINAINDDITGGIDEGATAAGADGDAIAAAAGGDFAAAQMTFDTYCVENGGIWDGDSSTCAWPEPPAPEDVIPAEVQESCDAQGGFVVKDPDGSWLCDTSAGTSTGGDTGVVAPVCSEITEEGQCWMSQGCAWDASSAGVCVDQPTYCAHFSVQNDCEASSLCQWNGTSCEILGAQ